MPRALIDNRPVEVPHGATILDAARLLHIDIPTLCHLKDFAPFTSCMVCLVKIDGKERLAPACATKVVDGMTIESETPEVRRARRVALELLLSEHAGDCSAPCQHVCPAHMNINEMLRLIAAKEFHRAAEVVKRDIPFPATLGRICPELCEKGCRRADLDGAVSICRLKRFVGDTDLATHHPYLPAKADPTGKRIAIIGAGPTGLSAAWFLALAGHAVDIYDARSHVGGALRSDISPALLPVEILDAETALLPRLGVNFILNKKLSSTTEAHSAEITLPDLQSHYDAILMALGPIDPATLRTFGLETLGKGIKIERDTFRTNLPRVYAAGAIVTPYRYAVRAVADGHAAAKSIDASLRCAEREPAQFSMRLGALPKVELVVLAEQASSEPRTPTVPDRDLTVEQAIKEASRCIQCGCSKGDDCLLRHYSTQYEVNSNHYRGERRPLERINTHPDILYEPGKCISCGRCVAIASRAGELWGLSMTRRGFAVKVLPSLGRSLQAALQKSAPDVIAACPTAALAWRRKI